MTLGSRRSAVFLFALYVSGIVALLFHLATEEHLGLPRQASVATVRRLPCKCSQGHTPHAAGDHEADQTTDEPQGPSLDLDMALAAFAVVAPAEEPFRAPELVLDPDTRVPVVWRDDPPRPRTCRPCEQPRAPPAA